MSTTNGIYCRKLKSGGYELAYDHVFETGVRGNPAEVRDYCNRLIITRDDRGRCRVCAGYRWDGASGGVPDNKRTMTASLEHDAEYNLGREGEMSEADLAGADDRFASNYVLRGGSKIIARFFVSMLRRFGQNARRVQDDAEAAIHHYP